jgi:hypothetical protein
MNRVALACAAVVVAGGAGSAFVSLASAEDCYGLNAARVCATVHPENLPSVNPTQSSVDECVHAGPTCAPVSVPVPGVYQPDGRSVEIGCYVGAKECLRPTKR